jgi:hypothetical protein
MEYLGDMVLYLRKVTIMMEKWLMAKKVVRNV